MFLQVTRVFHPKTTTAASTTRHKVLIPLHAIISISPLSPDGAAQIVLTNEDWLTCKESFTQIIETLSAMGFVIDPTKPVPTPQTTVGCCFPPPQEDASPSDETA